jgi:hypothetical protein
VSPVAVWVERPAAVQAESLARAASPVDVAALLADAAVLAAAPGAARANGAASSRGGRKWRQTLNPRSSLNPPHFSKHAARTRPSLEGARATIDEPRDKGEFTVGVVPPEGLEPPTP